MVANAISRFRNLSFRMLVVVDCNTSSSYYSMCLCSQYSPKPYSLYEGPYIRFPNAHGDALGC